VTAARQYRGRFAPSPTGPLHFGSLIAAVGSYLQARATNGEWIVRIEDLDRPRTVPGAAEAILESLQRFGMHWDGPVSYQSQRGEFYEACLQQLIASGLAFPCACSRREIREIAVAGADAPVYPGPVAKVLPAAVKSVPFAFALTMILSASPTAYSVT
jgi:glutamyl-Q tRNA(Asp) synthetase